MRASVLAHLSAGLTRTTKATFGRRKEVLKPKVCKVSTTGCFDGFTSANTISEPFFPAAATCAARYSGTTPKRCRRKRAREDDDDNDVCSASKRTCTEALPTYRGRKFSPLRLGKRSTDELAACAAYAADVDYAFAFYMKKAAEAKPLGKIDVAALARARVVEDICQREEDNAAGLYLLVQTFLRNDDDNSAKIDPADARQMFPNLEDVFLVAAKLSLMLRDEQQSGRDRIGSLLLVTISEFQKHTMPYAIWQKRSAANRLAYCEHDPAWADFFADAELELDAYLPGVGAAELLFAPIERLLITYPEMLSALLAATPVDHPDYEDIEQALVVLDRVNDDIVSTW